MRQSNARSKRALFGHRRTDVVDALARLSADVDVMAANLDRSWREKQELRRELENTRARHELELAGERARADRAEAEAQTVAAKIVGEAEEHAARIRSDSGRRIAETTSRLENLLRVREQVLGELRGILDTYGTLLEEVERGQPLAAVLAEEEHAFEDAIAPRIAAARERNDEHGEAAVFPRKVLLDAGPFDDFAELSAFERSLARLPRVADVYVRAFADDRADIELTLSEERPLVLDLTKHLPYGIRVTDGDDALRVELLTALAAEA